jgi:prephenate dehydrogenase
MIAEWRQKIDEIDIQLLQLLNQRAKWVQLIGEEKAHQRLPLQCTKREEEVLSRIETRNAGPLNAQAVKRIFEAIIAESRRLEVATAARRPSPYRRVTIIGLGLMGGSLGFAIKHCYRGVEVIGVDRGEAALRMAQSRGAVDRVLPLAAATAEAELIFLAAPVDAIKKLLQQLAALIGPKTMVTDLGSTKVQICEEASRLLPQKFVGGHPLAGSEKQGIETADPDLFQGAAYVLTPLQPPDGRANQLKAFLEGLGARVLYMEPQQHDRVVAHMSHLPQLLAVILAELVAELDGEGDHYRSLAARGFSDMTRIAASPYAIWKPILDSNRGEIDGALNAYLKRLSTLQQRLRAHGSLRTSFERAAAFRRSLDGHREEQGGKNH